MRPHAPHAFTQWAKEMPGATLRPKVPYKSSTGSRSNTAPYVMDSWGGVVSLAKPPEACFKAAGDFMRELLDGYKKMVVLF